MTKNNQDTLYKILNDLAKIKEELHSYGIFMGAAYTHESFSAQDLLGPSHTLKRCAGKIKKISNQLEVLMMADGHH